MIGSLIGAGIGALGGVLGGISKNKKLREQEKYLEEKRKQNKNWYDRRYNEDATQRADAQAMLTRTNEEIRNRNRAAAGSAAVMGGTEESLAATKEANAKTLADATSNIAVSAEARKDAIESKYMGRDSEINDQLAGVRSQKVGALDFVGNSVGAAAQGIGSALELEDK